MTCKNDCLSETYDKCLLYTGPDYEKFNIKNGQYYDKVILTLLDELKAICEETVELKCVFSNTCDNCDQEVEIPKAVQLIIDKICMLTASDVKYEGEHYCIGDSSISSGAVYMLGKTFNYNVRPTTTGSSVSYDLSDIEKSLPSDYRMGRVTTTISGKPKRGKSIILETSEKVVGATIGNDRFPINLDIDMRVNTPSGDVKLTKRLSIPTPQAGTYTGVLDVQDFGTVSSEKFTLETFVESVAAQVCSNKTELNSYNNIDLPGCEYLTHESKRLVDIIAMQNAAICDILARLEAVENITISVQEGDCGVKTYTGTPEQTCNRLSGICSGLRRDLNDLRSNVSTLNDTGANNPIIGGNCPGGNCGSTTPTTGCENGRCP